MAQTFKTLYFPPERTRSGRARRFTLGVPAGDPSTSHLLALSSRAVRGLLGDPVFEDLSDAAHRSHRTLNNHVLLVLSERVSQMAARSNTVARQQQLPLTPDVTDSPSVGLTFRDSKTVPYHRWYPYVEGFSADYVAELLGRFGHPRTVYDPFGGAGTTLLEASIRGIPSAYAEINPFMRFVAETKINSAAWARQHLAAFKRTATEYLAVVQSKAFERLCQAVSMEEYEAAFDERDFFVEQHLRELIAARDLARKVAKNEHARALLLLAVGSNVVKSSNMTRRADLRRRRPGEYTNRVVDVPGFISSKVNEMVEDLSSPQGPIAPTRLASEDSRAEGKDTGQYTLIITSPPYLNGTNYFRNTKLELWLLGWLSSETELGSLHRSGITAGINSVSRGRSNVHHFDQVEKVVAELEGRGDKRIPLLVRHYFSDMFDMLKATRERMEPVGRFVLDIGDSKFYGVHVPTDVLLANVAVEAGLLVDSTRVLARRYSYDRSKLHQVEIVLKRSPGARRNRESSGGSVERASRTSTRSAAPKDIQGRIESFRRELPYKDAPFSKRNWGHPLHSLCSYQGKLKPAIAHWIVEQFSDPGGTVVDPLGGIGTVAFEAALNGRNAITNDLSPLAYAVASGKIRVPSTSSVETSLQALERALNNLRLGEADKKSAEFGLNGSVADFFHPDTLDEVLKARRYFLGIDNPSDGDLFVKASLLHVLHGNRPYAISRTSHPITPFHPKGPRPYKSVLKHVRARVDSALREPLPITYVPGKSYWGDFRALPKNVSGADLIATSPPFLGMRFDRPNWLRMWFCGWEEGDFHTRSLAFLERQQTKDLDIYRDFFDACQKMLRPGGLLVVHLGGSDRHRMVEHLHQLMKEQFDDLGVVTEDVTTVEKHGIKDKGLTTSHNFLFGMRA
ncbi:MAG: DNA methyltransferase [Anaeromyxobacteraceae bacterium]